MRLVDGPSVHLSEGHYELTKILRYYMGTRINSVIDLLKMDIILKEKFHATQKVVDFDTNLTKQFSSHIYPFHSVTFLACIVVIQGFNFSCFKNFKAIPKFWITAKKREWCGILNW